MDQLRRLPYHAPAAPPPWAPERLMPGSPGAAAAQQQAGLAAPFAPEGGAALGVSHPSLCTMIDFFEDHEVRVSLCLRQPPAHMPVLSVLLPRHALPQRHTHRPRRRARSV